MLQMAYLLFLYSRDISQRETNLAFKSMEGPFASDLGVCPLPGESPLRYYFVKVIFVVKVDNNNNILNSLQHIHVLLFSCVTIQGSPQAIKACLQI